MKRIQIDKLGRIVIPITIRKALGIAEGSELDVDLEKDVITLKPPTNLCKLCFSSVDNSVNINLCNNCIKKIKALPN